MAGEAREVVQLVNLAPRVTLYEPSAHGVYPIDSLCLAAGGTRVSR